MSRLLKSVFVIVVAMMPTGMASAVTIQSGWHHVPANAVVNLPIYVWSGVDEEAWGVDLYVQIGNGGPTIGALQTHPPVPIITNISLLAPGAIFTPNNTGQVGTSTGAGNTYPDFAAVEGTTTNSGSVDPWGLLAVVTVDTTGAVPGAAYPLTVCNPDIFCSQMIGPGITRTQWTHGAIEINFPNPEPASALLLAAGAVVFLRRRPRREQR